MSITDYLQTIGEVTETTDNAIEVDVDSITLDELNVIHYRLAQMGMSPKMEIYPAIHDRLVTIKIK